MSEDDARRAAAWISEADAMIVTAGAGMGVDSGLPDFRGDEGFWKAYPPFGKLGLSFVALANPRWFRDDPALAWGFYGHRLQLYRATPPHGGFAILRAMAASTQEGAFVFTSNVDGAFDKAGFDPERIVECHGSIAHLQCTRGCGVGIYEADGYLPDIDESTFRARDPLPRCPRCGGLARPNILMFGDSGWESDRVEAQEARLERWVAGLRQRSAKVVVVECGAGKAVPTVRMFGERAVRAMGAKLVRINVRESDVPAGQIGISSGALAALTAIHEASDRKL